MGGPSDRTAIAELLIGQRALLLREDFSRIAVELEFRWEVFRGQEVTAVDFAAASGALEACAAVLAG